MKNGEVKNFITLKVFYVVKLYYTACSFNDVIPVVKATLFICVNFRDRFNYFSIRNKIEELK